MNNGDVVRLRTGGPQMTVNRRVDSKSAALFYECVWFSGAWDAQVLNREQFAEDSLVVMTPFAAPKAGE